MNVRVKALSCCGKIVKHGKKFLRKCWDLMRDKSETNGMMVNVQKPYK
jgi:hypothetical protein